ncbi:hypothetical protein BgiBS90_027204 [Biomphalaria glabrata]|nr:hypothetical protein BgiBS90_027204 [Biomphalaria glabrata]
MLLCIIFSVLTCFLTVTCQTDQQCRLEVSNKTAFENKIVDYIKEDATFMIIEYNLTITSNGNLSDWYNISDPFSIEPWRWYRAKGANMTRLLLMYNKILFGHLLFFDTFADIPVNLVDHPSGCLANISTTDMYSFIMRAVVEDFGVRFENLRTSEKLYQNPYVCTSRRDELTESKYKWCCKRDLHDDIVCEDVQEHSIALILIYIFAALVVWLLFLYSPYLLQADKRLIYESVSLEGFLPIQPSTSAASPNADSSKTDDPNADSSKTDSPKADSSKADSSKADCSKDDSSKDYSLMSDSSKADSSKHDLPKTYCLSYDSSKADSPIADSPKTDSPKAGSSKDYSSKDDTSKDDSSKADCPMAGSLKSDSPNADTSNKPSNKTDLKFRIKLNSYYEKDQPLPFGIFDLLRSYNCCGGNEDNSEKCCDGNCCRIYVRNNFPCSTVVRRLSVVFFFFVFPAIVLFIRYVSVSEMPVITSFVFLFIIYVSFYASMATICFERTARAYTRSFNELSETKFSKFCNIPMVTIISSPWISREKLNRESTEKTIQCDGANSIILFLSLIATVPACALTFVLVTAVVVIMYRVTFIYTIVSGIAAFLVYLREKVNEVRKQHERCLKIITEKIEDYITASNMTKADKNIYLYNEDKSLHNWSPREGPVTVKGCIPFLVLNRRIYIKDSVLFHFLRFEQKKVKDISHFFLLQYKLKLFQRICLI